MKATLRIVYLAVGPWVWDKPSRIRKWLNLCDCENIAGDCNAYHIKWIY